MADPHAAPAAGVNPGEATPANSATDEGAEEEVWEFKKVKRADLTTSHIGLTGGVGSKFGVTEAELEQLVAEVVDESQDGTGHDLGDAVRIDLRETIAYVSFATRAEGARAQALLHGRAWEAIRGRAIKAAFASRKQRRSNISPDSDPLSFNARRLVVPGLVVESEWITPEEEAALLGAIDASEWICGERMQRRVQHYGYTFNYETRTWDASAATDPIPSFLAGLVDRLAILPCFKGVVPNQVTVNEYIPGQGIRLHTDTHSAFEEPIASLSLASDVAFELRAPGGAHKPVLAAARSLIVLTGAARYLWAHTVALRRTDLFGGEIVERERRVSLTFRRIRTTPCDCLYPMCCDSQQETALQTNAHLVEAQHVMDFYEAAGAHFSATRHTPWPVPAALAEKQVPGALFLDVGCGNGRYSLIAEAAGAAVVACDLSEALLGICRGRGLDVHRSSVVSIPVRDEVADTVICIAVLHHLASHDHRETAVRELLRVLRRGGRLLIFAWAREQESG